MAALKAGADAPDAPQADPAAAPAAAETPTFDLGAAPEAAAEPVETRAVVAIATLVGPHGRTPPGGVRDLPLDEALSLVQGGMARLDGPPA